MPINFDTIRDTLAIAREFLRTHTNGTNNAILSENAERLGINRWLLRRVMLSSPATVDWYYHPYLTDLELQGRFVYAAYFAFRATGDVEWQNLGIEVTSNALFRFFPFNPTTYSAGQYLLPRPFYNVAERVVFAETQIDPPEDEFFQLEVPFTNGVGRLPTTFPETGEQVTRLYGVFSTGGELLLEQPDSALREGTAAGFEPIVYWTRNNLGRGVTVRIPFNAARTGRVFFSTQGVEPAGTIVLSNTNINQTLTAVYRRYYTAASLRTTHYFHPTDTLSRELGRQVTRMRDLWGGVDLFLYGTYIDQDASRNPIWRAGYGALYRTIIQLSQFVRREVRGDVIYIFKAETARPLTVRPARIFTFIFPFPPQWSRAIDGWAEIPVQQGNSRSLIPGQSSPTAYFSRERVNVIFADNLFFSVELEFDVTRPTGAVGFPLAAVIYGVVKISLFIRGQSLPYEVTTLVQENQEVTRRFQVRSFLRSPEASSIWWVFRISGVTGLNNVSALHSLRVLGDSAPFPFNSSTSNPFIRAGSAVIGEATYSTLTLNFQTWTAGDRPSAQFIGRTSGSFPHPPAIYYRSTGIATFGIAIPRTDLNRGLGLSPSSTARFPTSLVLYFSPLPNTNSNWTTIDLFWDTFTDLNGDPIPIPEQRSLNWRIATVANQPASRVEVLALTDRGTKWNFDSLNSLPAEERIIESVEFRFQPATFAANTFRLGNAFLIEESQIREEAVQFQPGLMPNTIRHTGAQPMDTYTLPPGIADQNAYYWHLWDQEIRFDNIISFYQNAQIAHAQNHPNYRFLAPYYLWTLQGDNSLSIRLGEDQDFGQSEGNVFSFTAHYPAEGRSVDYNLEAWLNIARILLRSTAAVPDIPVSVIELISEFILDMHAFYETRGNDLRPPTDFDFEGEGVRVNYDNPNSAAKIGIVAIAANYRRIQTVASYEILENCCDYLESQFVTSGVMRGSWSAGQRLESGGFRQYWGEWHANCVLFYSYLWLYRRVVATEELQVTPGEFPYEISIGGQTSRFFVASVAEAFDLPQTPIIETQFPHGYTQRVRTFEYQLGGMLRLRFKLFGMLEAAGLREFDRIHGGTSRPFRLRSESIPLPPDLVEELNTHTFRSDGVRVRHYWRLTEPIDIEVVKSVQGRNLFTATIEMRQVIPVGRPFEDID